MASPYIYCFKLPGVCCVTPLTPKVMPPGILSFLISLLFSFGFQVDTHVLGSQVGISPSRAKVLQKKTEIKRPESSFFSKMNFGTHSNYTQLTKTRHKLCARLRFSPQRIDAVVKIVDHVSLLSTCSHRWHFCPLEVLGTFSSCYEIKPMEGIHAGEVQSQLPGKNIRNLINCSPVYTVHKKINNSAALFCPSAQREPS